MGNKQTRNHYMYRMLPVEMIQYILSFLKIHFDLPTPCCNNVKQWIRLLHGKTLTHRKPFIVFPICLHLNEQKHLYHLLKYSMDANYYIDYRFSSKYNTILCSYKNNIVPCGKWTISCDCSSLQSILSIYDKNMTLVVDSLMRQQLESACKQVTSSALLQQSLRISNYVIQDASDMSSELSKYFIKCIQVDYRLLSLICKLPSFYFPHLKQITIIGNTYRYQRKVDTFEPITQTPEWLNTLKTVKIDMNLYDSYKESMYCLNALLLHSSHDNTSKTITPYKHLILNNLTFVALEKQDKQEWLHLLKNVSRITMKGSYGGNEYTCFFLSIPWIKEYETDTLASHNEKTLKALDNTSAHVTVDLGSGIACENMFDSYYFLLQKKSVKRVKFWFQYIYKTRGFGMDKDKIHTALSKIGRNATCTFDEENLTIVNVTLHFEM
jgi:hypothetical protein